MSNTNTTQSQWATQHRVAHESTEPPAAAPASRVTGHPVGDAQQRHHPAIHTVATTEQAAGLGEWLLTAHRPKPVVVVSTPAGHCKPWTDLALLAAEIGNLAELYLIPTGPVTWELARLLPTRTEIYGAAARLYPTDLAWAEDPYRSALRVCWTPADAARTTEALINDVHTAACVGDHDHIPGGQAAAPAQPEQRNQTLETRLAEAEAERDRLRAQVRTGEKRQQSLKKQLNSMRARHRGDRHDEGALFSDPSEQFRHDVYLSWARRVPAPEKPSRPLPAYSIGPDFLQTLQSIEGLDPSKIVDVVVDLLTGRDDHGTHPLRDVGGRPVIRGDGAICQRAAVQRNAPAARRLHYWKAAGGLIELSRVVIHDDMNP
ncbi:hypothetical protein ACWEV3_01110 [Saccharopolyspora sp. NPDC003752]